MAVSGKMERVEDGLFSIDEPTLDGARETTLMTSVQRRMIRELFAQINVTNARDQFRMVADLTGVSISSVSELDVAAANVLIRQLKSHGSITRRESTGNAWDDRDEETWIDRL